MIVKNQKGFLAMDFLFGLTLVFSLLVIIMTFTLTLSTIEVVQYAAFSAGRVFMAANNNQVEGQQGDAKTKYSNVLNQPAFRYVSSGGLFRISSQSGSAEPTTIGYPPTLGPSFQGYQPDTGETILAMGVTAELQAPLLDRSVPFFGSTSSQPGQTGNFTTVITGFLGREPTQDECLSFARDKFNVILQLQNQLGNESFQSAPNPVFYPGTDNGC